MADAKRELSLAQVGVELDSGAAALRDTSGLMRVFGVTVAADTKVNFDSGAGPDGAAWPPLAHPRADGRGGLPLRRQGLLMASVVARGAGHVEQLGPTTLVYGTNRPGARLQQEGGTVTPKGHPFLAIPATREAERAGSPRRFPRPLTVRLGHRGGVFLALRGRGRSAVLEVVYFLVRSVTVPARPYLGAGERLIGKLVQAALDWWAGRAAGR